MYYIKPKAFRLFLTAYQLRQKEVFDRMKISNGYARSLLTTTAKLDIRFVYALIQTLKEERGVELAPNELAEVARELERKGYEPKYQLRSGGYWRPIQWL